MNVLKQAWAAQAGALSVLLYFAYGSPHAPEQGLRLLMELGDVLLDHAGMGGLVKGLLLLEMEHF